jgi:hypothetical protein
MNISFALTTEQVRRRIKTETRRLGWQPLMEKFQWTGEYPILQGIVKGQGLKKGEHPELITPVRIVHMWREPLNKITEPAVVREGFPHLSPREFVDMFCQHNSCKRNTVVTCIAFDYPWRVRFVPSLHVIMADNTQAAEQHAKAHSFPDGKWICALQNDGLRCSTLNNIKVWVAGNCRDQVGNILPEFGPLYDLLTYRELRHDRIWWATSQEMLYWQVENCPHCPYQIESHMPVTEMRMINGRRRSSAKK